MSQGNIESVTQCNSDADVRELFLLAIIATNEPSLAEIRDIFRHTRRR